VRERFENGLRTILEEASTNRGRVVAEIDDISTDCYRRVGLSVNLHLHSAIFEGVASIGFRRVT
jgi:hypothetical protein